MKTFGRDPVPQKPVTSVAWVAGVRDAVPPADRSGKSSAQGSLAYKRAMMQKKGARREGR